jgi:hypothetical protein
MKNRNGFFLILNDFWAETELCLHAQRARPAAAWPQRRTSLGSTTHNRPGQPQGAARVCAQCTRCDALCPRRAQSACHGTAGGGSLAAKPQQDVHRKLPQPMVHSPDTIESPNSQCGRWAMKGRSSPARSTAPELNGGEGVIFLVQEVALNLKEAPGPTQREWERVSGPVHGEWQQIGGVIGRRITGADKRAAVEAIVHGRGAFL